MNPTPDSTLADPQQVIADLERKLAEAERRLNERIAERDEGEAQKAAMTEVLQVINASPGDLAPVFETVLEKAMELCGIAFGNLQLYEGGKFRGVALRGVHTPALAQLLREPNEPVPGGPSARLLSGERFVHIVDIAEAAKQFPNDLRGQANAAAGSRTVLFVPLRRDSDLLGFIGGYRKEVRPFTDKQIALLENFAAQAVIAIDNARLISETREALDQQTATAEVLGVINSSPGDLAPVFDAILQKAHSLCGAEQGRLFTYNGEIFWPVAAHGLSQQLPVPTEWMREGFRPAPGNPFVSVIEGAPLVHIADIRQLAEQFPNDLGLRTTVENGLRTFLVMPLRKEDALLGVITAVRREVRPFSDKQIALLQNFAAQAVIAMENARLITETREALEQQTATAEVLQVINASPGDLKPVFDAMLEKATRLCEADFGILWIFDGGLATAGALHRVPAAYADMIRAPFRPSPESGPARMMRGDSTFVVPNLLEFPPYHAGDTLVKAIVDLAGARTVVISPLRKDALTIGAITVYRQEVRPFTEKQIGLLENFAAQAVIAMENARLITETREALEQQTATAEVLGVINSSPGDLAPVFEAILEKAHRICSLIRGSLVTYDGSIFTTVMRRGIGEQVATVMSQARSTLQRALLRGDRLVHIPDLLAYPWDPDDTVTRLYIEASKLRAGLLVPLRKDGVLLGYISGYRDEAGPFSEKEIALVENFAAQAVIAMENARLLGELRQRTEEVGELNRDLEARVAEQVDELGRVGRLKRFLAPQLAELIVSRGDEKILESHRREIVVVFCDLRGYTAFTETAEPEEVLDFLREYHGALGPLVSQFEGTLDQFSGDGIMVFFNDPVPCADPAERAINMAVAMRSAANTLIADWRERGRDLGFGAGIAQGYATLGQIGFSERSGYTAIGTVCNVAARLCAEAKDGQILLGQRVNVALKGSVATEQLGALTLKGLTQPVVAYNVPLGAIQPALRVIEGGSPETV